MYSPTGLPGLLWAPPGFPELSGLSRALRPPQSRDGRQNLSLDARTPQKVQASTLNGVNSPEGLHEQFRSNSRAVHEHFTSNSRAIQVTSRPRAVHELFTSSSRAIHEQFTSSSRALQEQSRAAHDQFTSSSRSFHEHFRSSS